MRVSQVCVKGGRHTVLPALSRPRKRILAFLWVRPEVDTLRHGTAARMPGCHRTMCQPLARGHAFNHEPSCARISWRRQHSAPRAGRALRKSAALKQRTQNQFKINMPNSEALSQSTWLLEEHWIERLPVKQWFPTRPSLGPCAGGPSVPARDGVCTFISSTHTEGCPDLHRALGRGKQASTSMGVARLDGR